MALYGGPRPPNEVFYSSLRPPTCVVLLVLLVLFVRGALRASESIISQSEPQMRLGLGVGPYLMWNGVSPQSLGAHEGVPPRALSDNGAEGAHPKSVC